MLCAAYFPISGAGQRRIGREGVIFVAGLRGDAVLAAELERVEPLAVAGEGFLHARLHLLTANHGVKYSQMIEFTLNGVCLEYDFRALIVTGAGAEEAAARSKWPIIAKGKIDLHLGVALFDRPYLFTPTRIITERQQSLEGEAVFDWLVEGCYRMPRSEVFGIDAFGSQDAQVFARDIDVEESPIAVYGHGTWVAALVEIDPVLGTDVRQCVRPELPARWIKALKQYRAGPAVKLANLL